MPTAISRESLTMISRNDVARTAFKGIELIERETPAAQLLATAFMLLALAEKHKADPRDILTLSERVLAARHEVYDRRSNQWFAAISDYIDHVHNPLTNLGLRPPTA